MWFGFLSGSELLLVFVAIIILFGATRIPQLGDALGRGIHNFRKAVTGGSEEKDNPPLPENKQNPKP
jgi:sec-independent protein translocase protein TatA